MRLFSSLQHALAPVFGFIKKHAVATGAICLAILCVGVLVFDGAVFYADVVLPRPTVAGSGKKAPLSEQEITETIRLADERQKEFDDILNAVGGSGNDASSTITQPPSSPSSIGKTRIRR